MILYHGTNTDFTVIDLSKSHRHKDFGRGFYLTNIESQARQLAEKKARILGGTPIVQRYEFDESELRSQQNKVLIFEKVSVEWAEFIFKNRRKAEVEFVHPFDIVVGPIADDGVAYLLNRYEEGSYTIEQLAHELEYKKLNNQYYFGTPKAIKLLKRIHL